MILIILSLGFVTCGKDEEKDDTRLPLAESFSNPILPSGPDPWVIKKDKVYYYMHTQGNKIGIWKTDKMSLLSTVMQKIVWTPTPGALNFYNVWAPELHYLQGKWYIYFTAGPSPDLSSQRLFVLENSAADPTEGNWVEKGKLAIPNGDFFSIDATILTHQNTNYVLWSGNLNALDNTQRIFVARLSNPWTIDSARELIASPQFPWEMVGAPPVVNEAPQVLHNKDGRLIIIFSASGCWTDDYSLGMLTLKPNGNPLSPADWTKHPQPVFKKNTAGAAFGPGHCSFFQSPDSSEDWIIYHANANTGKGCGDLRSPRMQPFVWKADGTPDFGEPVSTSVRLRKPAGE